MKLRRIAPMRMPDVTPGGDLSRRPTIERVDPRQLFVDEQYQRNLSERSVNLIRRMVARWNWDGFVPPSCARQADGSLHIVNGQHTAIAAATRGIEAIDVLVIAAATQEERAQAFIAHNKDRVLVTAQQVFFAKLAAGDEMAQDIERVCQRAKVTLLKWQPSYALYKPGQTVAIASIGKLIRSYGVARARRALEVCVEAGCAPIQASEMTAVAALLFSPGYADSIEPETIAFVMRDMGGKLHGRARKRAADERTPIWKAMAEIILREGERSGSRRG